MKKELDIIIKKEISPILKQVESMSILSGEEMKLATELLSKINTYADYLKEDRLKLTKPLEDSLKLIRVKYSDTEKSLKEAVDIIKGKMGSYQSLALEEARKQEAKIASDVSSGKIKKIDTAIRKIGEIDLPEEKVKTDSGSVSFRTIKKCEVIDLFLLPIEYHLANEIKIRKAMSEEIYLQGVRYFEEQNVINKRN